MEDPTPDLTDAERPPRSGLSRRDYLKLAGAGVLVAGGLGVASSGGVRFVEGGPPDRSRWDLAFESRFDGDGLDTAHWSVGWGWGTRTTTSPTRIVPANVEVRDGTLVLRGTHAGSDIRAGAVNTKDKVTFGPGSFVEARIRFAVRRGFQNAFWAKPNSEAWPPELDVVELWNAGNEWNERHHSHHTVHYSRSTMPGDKSTERSRSAAYAPGGDLGRTFHVYAAEWQPDAVRFFVDGLEVARFTDETMLAAMRAGAPFYLMANINIDNIGTADRTQSWGDAMRVDWVRLWDYAPTAGT